MRPALRCHCLAAGGSAGPAQCHREKGIVCGMGTTAAEPPPGPSVGRCPRAVSGFAISDVGSRENQRNSRYLGRSDGFSSSSPGAVRSAVLRPGLQTPRTAEAVDRPDGVTNSHGMGVLLQCCETC